MASMMKEDAELEPVLSSEFQGDKGMLSQILGEWLQSVDELCGTQDSNSSNNISNGKGGGAPAELDIEAEATDITALMIQQKFQVDVADKMIARGDPPTWLKDLIDDEIYRRMLIGLYNKYSDSNLLGYCLKEMSSKGYHGDIAKTIKESNFFSVFNDLFRNMVVSVLTHPMREEPGALLELMSNIKRCTTSGEYTFYFAVQLLNVLEEKLVILSKDKKIPWSNIHVKVRWMRQELEDAAVWSNQPKDNPHASLDPRALFALKLCGLFNDHTLNAVFGEKDGTKVQQIFQAEPSADKLRFLFDIFFPQAKSTTNPLELVPTKPVAFLRHPKVLQYLTHVLMTSDSGAGDNAKFSHLLAVACADASVPLTADVQLVVGQKRKTPTTSRSSHKAISVLYEKLLDVSALVKQIGLDQFQNLSPQSLQQMFALLADPDTPLPTMCIITWIKHAVGTNSKKGKEVALLPVMPLLLQCLVKAVGSHPEFYSEVFSTLLMILDLNRFDMSADGKIQATKDSYTMLRAHNQALEALVYLMGIGRGPSAALQVIDYLATNVGSFDGVMVRHLLNLLASHVKLGNKSTGNAKEIMAIAKPLKQLLLTPPLTRAAGSSSLAQEDAEAYKTLLAQLDNVINNKEIEDLF